MKKLATAKTKSSSKPKITTDHREPGLVVEQWHGPAEVVEDDPAYSDTEIPDLSDDDPDIEVGILKRESRTYVKKMIPELYEKFRNASAKDAAAVFTALADRADFVPPATKQPAGGNTTNILNLAPEQLLPLIEGIKTITSGDKHED